jgi:endonuclease YncB( thermonuclease family)
VVVLVLLQTAYGAEHEVTRVHDGDTIKVMGDSGELTIRLAGIDAPEKSKRKRESGQPFSQQATKYLAGLVLNKCVGVKECGVDRYGRILGIVVLGGKDINLAMVKMGFAEVYRGKPARGFDLAPYIAAQNEAMDKERGMWVQGLEYISPRDWRRREDTVGLGTDHDNNLKTREKN